jgi:hypothetical protein
VDIVSEEVKSYYINWRLICHSSIKTISELIKVIAGGLVKKVRLTPGRVYWIE